MIVIKEESYISWGDELSYFTIERDGVLLSTVDQEWEMLEWVNDNIFADEGVDVLYK